jgi:Insertion element 4 transposase N-terminal
LPVHGATCWGWLSPRGRVLSRAGVGVLGWFIPPGLVDEAVGDGLAWEMRLRSLPARLGVYFVLGCCLFSVKPYPDVIREVTAGLQGALAAVGWEPPATTALSGQDSAEHGQAANPQLRLVTLLACGTRALLDAAFGPVRGKGTGEQALARQLLGSLRPGMLLLADRNSTATRCGPPRPAPARTCCGGSRPACTCLSWPSCPTGPSWRTSATPPRCRPGSAATATAAAAAAGSARKPGRCPASPSGSSPTS